MSSPPTFHAQVPKGYGTPTNEQEPVTNGDQSFAEDDDGSDEKERFNFFHDAISEIAEQPNSNLQSPSVDAPDVTHEYDTKHHDAVIAEEASEHIDTLLEAERKPPQVHPRNIVTDIRGRRISVDDPNTVLLNSLRMQVGDLSSQVTSLNAKLVKSYDRIGDLEEDLDRSESSRLHLKGRVTSLDSERKQWEERVEGGLLVEKVISVLWCCNLRKLHLTGVLH